MNISKSTHHKLATKNNFTSLTEEKLLKSNDIIANNNYYRLKHVYSFYYCRIQRNWRLGLSLCSEARCGQIFLKFLHNNLALIYINFCHLEKFSDHRGFFWNVEKKKWSGFLEYFRNSQLERNFLCYESCRKNLFGCFTYWDIGDLKNLYFLEISQIWPKVKS
jgi:hypothetical protein